MGLKDRLQGAAEKAKAAVDKAQEIKAARDDARAEARNADGILWQGTSHDEGRNSTVTLYRDRFERTKERSRTSLSRAKQDTESTPIKAVSSVQAKKDGLRYTKVSVFASGNTIEFRIAHEEAQLFKDEIMNLVLHSPMPARTQGPTDEPDSLDQLKKLAELRDAGIISSEEFDAKKKQLLDL